MKCNVVKQSTLLVIFLLLLPALSAFEMSTQHTTLVNATNESVFLKDNFGNNITFAADGLFHTWDTTLHLNVTGLNQTGNNTGGTNIQLSVQCGDTNTACNYNPTTTLPASPPCPQQDSTPMLKLIEAVDKKLNPPPPPTEQTTTTTTDPVRWAKDNPLVILIVIAIAIGGYVLWKKQHPTNQQAQDGQQAEAQQQRPVQRTQQRRRQQPIYQDMEDIPPEGGRRQQLPVDPPMGRYTDIVPQDQQWLQQRQQGQDTIPEAFHQQMREEETSERQFRELNDQRNALLKKKQDLQRTEEKGEKRLKDRIEEDVETQRFVKGR